MTHLKYSLLFTFGCKMIPWRDLLLCSGMLFYFDFRTVAGIVLLDFPSLLLCGELRKSTTGALEVSRLSPMDCRHEHRSSRSSSLGPHLDSDFVAGGCEWLGLCCHRNMAGDYSMSLRVPSPGLHFCAVHVGMWAEFRLLV